MVMVASDPKLCSTEHMEGRGSHALNLPTTCRRGHSWGADRLTVSWESCECSTEPRAGLGHLVVHCPQAGCPETWPADTETVLGVLEDRNRLAAGDRESAQAMAILDAVWTLLMQAHEHLRELLRSSHPSAARMARLRSWAQDCVTALDTARQSEVLIARSGELAQIADIALQMESIVDSSQMYASLHERFRSTSRATIGSSPARSLTDVADDERVLLSGRASLRESVQELIDLL
jgi:hypothetical protein